MRVQHFEGDATDLFLTYRPHTPLTACIGLAEASGEPLRIAFDPTGGGNVLIVGRSREAALGTCTTILLDLASQILSTPGRRGLYTTAPFSIIDFLRTEESRIFTDAAMALPLSVKLELLTDTALNTLTDFQVELARRQREPDSPRHPKFLFLCGLQAGHGIRSRGFYALPDVNPHAPKLTQLLQFGKFHSLYTIAWCNSFANLELTMGNGISSFGRLIILDGAGPIPDQLSHVDTEPADRAWYVDGHRNPAVPFFPFAVPAEAWCNALIRTFE
jgi:hypothetical protein